MRRDAIFIDRASPVPLHLQLEAALRTAIISGKLRPGERVLSSREFGTHLGVSRNTVTEALNRLEADGYIVTRRGAGTFVAQIVPYPPPLRVSNPAPQLVPSASAQHFVKARALTDTRGAALAFRAGLPALDSFPLVQFRSCFKATDWNAEFPDPAGLPALRAAIADRIRVTRGVVCSAEKIFITTSAQSSFDIILRALLRPGDQVAIEDPYYFYLVALLRALNVPIVPIPVDSDGLRTAALEGVRAKVVYVTPSHQYPTGAVLSLEKRRELLHWAVRNDAWVIEDDYDSEFNYSGHAYPALQALDEAHRVIYVGTFSKVLSPALRVAYVVVPEGIADSIAAVHQLMGAVPAFPIQAALARFIGRGHLGRHVAKMRKLYDERRRAAIQYLTSPRRSPFTVRDSAAGLHFIAELPPSLPDTLVAELAAETGVVMRPLSRYYLGPESINAVVIGYAATPAALAQKAARDVLRQIHMRA